MADITWDNVVAIASELVDVDPAAQVFILAHVNSAFNPAMFGAAQYDLIRIYLAAHVGSYSLPEGTGFSAGDVVSETVGGISRTYAVVAAASSGDGLDGTSYGTLYAFLMRTSRGRLPRVLT